MIGRTLKLAVLAGLLLLVAAGIATAAVTLSDETPTSPATVTDVKGPCDEAEHANDPECAGPQVPEDDPTVGPSASPDAFDDDDDGDISGPCDEAEHANDPRCTGGIPAGEDNSGPGNGDDDGDEDNSGPSEDSGPGSGADDGDGDDRSGSNEGPG